MNTPEDGNFLSRWASRKAQARRAQPAHGAATAAPGVSSPSGLAGDTLDADAPDTHARSKAPSADRDDHNKRLEVAPAAGDVDSPQPAQGRPPAPSLADVALLTPESDYTRFVVAGIDPLVQRAAMKKLFSDPHFNIMDGLDTYIDDYGKSDPIPAAMLRQMNQSQFLGLFDDEADTGQAAIVQTERIDLALADADTDADTHAIGGEAVGDRASESSPPPNAANDRAQNPTDDDPDLRLQQDDASRRPSAPEGART
ncbi:MAG: DUF3306 domain-containing protein [Variovorax sp.]